MDALSFKAELEGVVDALNEAAVEFALCGGMALGVHGFVRATRDFDFVLHEAHLDRAKAAAARVGFTLTAEPMVFKKGKPEETIVHRVSKALGTSLLTVDFLLARGYLAEVLVGRREVEWSGRRLSVVSAVDLIKMKRVANRPQDRADVVRLEAILRGEPED